MMVPTVGLLDTSVFIAHEAGRPIDEGKLPPEQMTSVITLAELEAGVLNAHELEARTTRLATLQLAFDMPVLPTDERAAHFWAYMRAYLAEQKRRVNINDLWIAATAVANQVPVVTQDKDFDPLEGVKGLKIIRV